jgi:translation initiation factor IF-3
VRFKGREMAHTELGWKMLNRMQELMSDLAVVESHRDGRTHAEHDPLAEAH